MATFLIFLAAYVLSQFFRSFLAVIAPELAAEILLSPADLGLVSAAWFAAFAIAQLPVGLALDRIGPRRTVPSLMLAAVAGAGLLAIADSRGDCLVAMALIGIGCSPIYMGAVYVFGRIYQPHQFAMLSSWLLGIGSGGNLLAATPLAWAAQEIGWRNAFLVIAALTLASAVIVWLLIRDPPRAHQPTGDATSWLRQSLAVLRIRQLWPLLPIMTVSYAVVIAERGLWIGPYLAEVHGLEPVARGNVTLVLATAMSAGALLYGPLDQWLGTRKWIVVAGSFVTALCFLVLARWPFPSLAATTTLYAILGAAGLTYAMLLAHGRAFLPDHLLGRGITFMNFVFISGAGLLQWISGLYVESLKSAGDPPPSVYAALHLVFALTLLATTVVYLWSRDKPPPRPARANGGS